MSTVQHSWYVIMNPEGGNGAVRKQWPQIENLLREMDFSYVIVFTEARMHAAELVRKGLELGYRKIMAVGGDGTNNEVINGILKQGLVDSREITYALVPVGTGNDWIRTVGIPEDHRKWLGMIGQEKTRLMDAGRVQCMQDGKPVERYFVNVAGMAYDAYVVRQMEMAQTKGTSSLIYFWMLLKCLFQYRLQKAVVKHADGQIRDRFYTINVGNCKYSGGGMLFVPHADPYDGELAVTLVGSLNKLGVLRALPYLYNGKIGRHPKATVFSTKKIEVDTEHADDPLYLEVDGELAGQAPATFEVREQVLRIVVPV